MLPSTIVCILIIDGLRLYFFLLLLRHCHCFRFCLVDFVCFFFLFEKRSLNLHPWLALCRMNACYLTKQMNFRFICAHKFHIRKYFTVISSYFLAKNNNNQHIYTDQTIESQTPAQYRHTSWITAIQFDLSHEILYVLDEMRFAWFLCIVNCERQTRAMTLHLLAASS